MVSASRSVMSSCPRQRTPRTATAAAHRIPRLRSAFVVPVRPEPLGRTEALVGVLGNNEIALALVMTAGMVIALLALLVVGVPAAETKDDVTGDAVAEAAVDVEIPAQARHRLGPLPLLRQLERPSGRRKHRQVADSP